MASKQNKPKKYDVVLGGKTPPPSQSAILGGIQGIQRRLESGNIKTKLVALQDALNYESSGLELVIKALDDESARVRNCAYRILLSRNELHIKEILSQIRFWDIWDLRERVSETLNNGYLYSHFNIFYNLPVEKYEPEQGLHAPIDKSYVVSSGDLISLLGESLNNEIEALIFMGDYTNTKWLKKDTLKNLKAVFYGICHDDYYPISEVEVPDIGVILKAYPNLKMLQIRGSDGYRSFRSENWHKFNDLKHENLQALIVESGGLGRNKIAHILSANLPALEHLELWLGSSSYGGNSSVEDLMPIFSDELFPNLHSLGLRNSEYTNDIAATIVNNPIMNNIKILDLSLGNLTDEGAEVLINCPVINNLEVINVADNCLSDDIIDALNNLDVEVIVGTQKHPDERYCSVSE